MLIVGCFVLQKPQSGVYYKQYTNGTATSDSKLAVMSTEISARFHTTFVAQWMLVVTWQEMEYPSNPNQVRSTSMHT